MEGCKISIITVCFNASKIIEETILSVINQKYEYFEYIVIDGASTDGTIDIIKRYESRITQWISAPDKGIYDAMNKGITMATGEWIIFMNAGDVFYDHNILVELNKRNVFNDCDLVYGDVIGRYAIGNRLLKAGNIKDITKTMQFSHQSMFVKTALMKEKKFALKYRLAADYNFILSMYLGRKRFHYIPIPISIIEADEGATFTNFIKSKKEVYDIHLSNGFCVLRSVYYCYYYIIRFYLSYYVKKLMPVRLCKKIIGID